MDHNTTTTTTNEDDVVSRTGSIAERRAAKCGFKAERINTARFRSTTSPLASPAVRSPRLTIPPGISPTALLDSPILLPNSQPSPTTGTFPFPLCNTVNPADGDKGSDVGSSFGFKSFGHLDSLPVFSSLENQVSSPSGLVQRTDVNSQGLLSVEPPTDFEFPAQYSKATTNAYAPDSVTDVKGLNNMIVSDSRADLEMCLSDVASDKTSLHKEPIQGEDVGTRHLLEEDQMGTCPPMVTVRTSEDGYNWRKYGQKQVKGSEYPRSYYKCTHPNCQVKKKVERSHDGQITEIIYKGAHNHQKPQPSRRASLGSTCPLDEMSEMGEGSGTCVKAEGGSVWRNIQNGSRDVKLGSEWRADGPERTSSTSVVTELSDPLSATQGKSVGVFESAETPEFSSTLANHDDNDDDGATQGSISLGDDVDDDESKSKRRRIESSLIETNLASRAVREPRVVVQIESEVDILDDGYRWRKYGQKVVKGNPNPRSYYKCTSPGCSVRKHVERASHNLKCVITTYEGKHNHEVPAARNSSHVNSSGAAIANAQSTLTLPRTTHGPKPETQTQNITPCFDRKPEFNTEYLRPSFLGNFGNEMKFGASSMYQMKFPPLQNMVSYTSFGLNSNRSATQQLGSIPSVVPDFPISLPLSLSTSANLSLAGMKFNNNGKPVGPVPPFFPGQQLKDNETRFLRPKEEQKDDTVYDACMPIVDHANASSSSYHRVMGNFSS